MGRTTRFLAHVHDLTSEPIADAGRFVGRKTKAAADKVAAFKDQVLEDHEALEARKAKRQSLKAKLRSAKDTMGEKLDAVLSEDDDQPAKKAAARKASAKPRTKATASA
jgi:hypothetical protein